MSAANAMSAANSSTTIQEVSADAELCFGIEVGMDPNESNVARDKVLYAKRSWTESEDKLLVETVTKLGAHNWSRVASHLTARIGKQCRERWFNHLCPEVKKGGWTEEEDRLIAEGVAELGPKWSEVVKRLPGRTDNAIKNRYNSNQRRRQRQQRRELVAERGEQPSVGSTKRKLKRSKADGEAVEGEEGEEHGNCGEEMGADDEEIWTLDTMAQHKRQRILGLASQIAALGSDSEADEGRSALVEQLKQMTRAGHTNFKPFVQKEPEPHRATSISLDLEQCVEELFEVASSRSTSPHELVEDFLDDDWLVSMDGSVAA